MSDKSVETGAEAFIAANKASPVVSGTAIGKGGEGGYYTLQNGRTFKLSREECAQIGHPRWKL